MARPSKNQVKSTGGNKDVQVKYADARMAYMNTKKELVVKESNIEMGQVFVGVAGSKSLIVVCEDHLGYYLTSKSYVDAPLLDPYRNYRRNEYQLTHNEDDTFKIITTNNIEYVI